MTEPSSPPTPDPAPPAPPPEPAPPDPAKLAEDVARLTTALDQERRRAAAFEGQLTKLKNAQLTEQEKAVEAAKAEGRSGALREAGVRLAGAEFRAAAAGKITDPMAALEIIDLSKFVSETGEVDSAGLGEMVTKLAGAMPAPPAPGQVPPGPRGAPPADDDFLRASLRSAQ